MTDPSIGPDEHEHILPSGLKVTVKSHRVLRRADIHKVWAAGNNAEPGFEAGAQRDTLMGMLVASTSDPQRFPVPLATETLNALDGADYTALYRLMADGWKLAFGVSVVPNPDDYQDPKAPTAASNGSAPASADTTSPAMEPTGTTSTTTNTSTEPEPGPPLS